FSEQRRGDKVMSNSRRGFLATSSAALLGAVSASAAGSAEEQAATPGSQPGFGITPPAGPEVTEATFAEAQKLVQLQLTSAERAQAAQHWRESMAALCERRTGPRKVALSTNVAPYSLHNALLTNHRPLHSQDRFVRSGTDPGKLPDTNAEIAFAPVWKLS